MLYISICDFAMVLTLIFTLFIALIFNRYIKLSCIIGKCINKFLSFFGVLFLEFSIFSRLAGFFSLVIILLLCVFNILQVSYFLQILTIIIHLQVLFFFLVRINIEKDADCLQSNNNDSLNDLWLLFLTLVFFLERLV